MEQPSSPTTPTFIFASIHHRLLLRDSLYIPLGDNRRGERRTYLNLMATMMLGGLWHGANWTSVIWGGLHGVYLAIERGLKSLTAGRRLPTGILFKLLLGLITYRLVNITWVLFRAEDLSSAMGILGSMVGLQAQGTAVLPTVKMLETVLCIGGLLCAQWYMRNRELEEVVTRAPRVLVGAAWAGMAFAIIITQGAGDAFIYFQF